MEIDDGLISQFDELTVPESCLAEIFGPMGLKDLPNFEAHPSIEPND